TPASLRPFPTRRSSDLLVDGQNPIARTNVAPVVGPPGEASLYGFGYTAPGGPPTPTFVVAGSGETRRNDRGVVELVRRDHFGARSEEHTSELQSPDHLV